MNFQDFPAGNFAVNGATFKPPSVPVLLQILSGAQDVASLLPSGSVYSLPRNKVIEISIPGGLNVRNCAFDVVSHLPTTVHSTRSIFMAIHLMLCALRAARPTTMLTLFVGMS